MKFLRMPTCKEVFSKRHEMEEMPFLQKMSYMAHKMMCKNCQGFLETMKVIESKMVVALKDKGQQASSERIKEIQDKAKAKINNLDK